uniref:PEGA domain-containing protein n=1 Tax=Fervidobacterium thailandense TaxID=1008305 RepID=A0A7C4GIX3_9BACT
MPKIFVRVIFYLIFLVSIFLLILSVRFVLKIKNAPLVVVEPLGKAVIVNGKRFEGPLALKRGRYLIQGESTLKIFGNRIRIVRIPIFEVEIKWEK